MRVDVRYFAVLREHRGEEEEKLEVEQGLTVAELYRRLFPPSSSGSLPVMFAVNQAYVESTHVLQEGDEVAFIPPLGGG